MKHRGWRKEGKEKQNKDDKSWNHTCDLRNRSEAKIRTPYLYCIHLRRNNHEGKLVSSEFRICNGVHIS